MCVLIGARQPAAHMHDLCYRKDAVTRHLAQHEPMGTTAEDIRNHTSEIAIKPKGTTANPPSAGEIAMTTTPSSTKIIVMHLGTTLLFVGRST